MVVKKGIWIVVPLLLLGATACTSGTTETTTTTTATVEASGPGLEGVEFIVHQVPG